MKTVSEKLELCINVSKTKAMVVDLTNCLPISTALSEYKKVNTFVYLGSASTIDTDGGSSAEIRRQITLDIAAMTIDYVLVYRWETQKIYVFNVKTSNMPGSSTR